MASGLDDFVADGVDDEFGDGMEAELEHDVGAMSFGGIDADTEESGDFFVAFAFGEELKDFALSRSEAGARGLVGFGRVVGVAGGRDARGEVRLMVVKSIDRGEQDAVSVVLEDIAVRARLDDLLNEIIGLVHGEDENFRGGRRFADAPSSLDAIEERHTDIEDGDVGLALGSFFDGVAAVGSFGAHFPSGVRLEESTQTSADHRVVIGDEDAKGCHRETPLIQHRGEE
jgi:hypothetical protein